MKLPSRRLCSDLHTQKLLWTCASRRITADTTEPANSKSLSVQNHLSKLNMDESSKMPTLNDVKIAYLLRCRQIHPLCGGDPEAYAQLKQSYAIVCAHISGGNIRDFHPHETATDMYYNTREVHEIRSYWGGSLIFLIGTAFIILIALFNYMNYKLWAEELEDLKAHIVADTNRPWWHDEVGYEHATKRLFIEQWMETRGDEQKAKLMHEGALIGAGKQDPPSLEVLEPSPKYIAALRRKVKPIV